MIYLVLAWTPLVLGAGRPDILTLVVGSGTSPPAGSWQKLVDDVHTAPARGLRPSLQHECMTRHQRELPTSGARGTGTSSYVHACRSPSIYEDGALGQAAGSGSPRGSLARGGLSRRPLVPTTRSCAGRAYARSSPCRPTANGPSEADREDNLVDVPSRATALSWTYTARTARACRSPQRGTKPSAASGRVDDVHRAGAGAVDLLQHDEPPARAPGRHAVRAWGGRVVVLSRRSGTIRYYPPFPAPITMSTACPLPGGGRAWLGEAEA